MRTELTSFLTPTRLDPTDHPHTSPDRTDHETDHLMTILEPDVDLDRELDGLDLDDLDDLDIVELDRELDELESGAPLVDALAETGRARCADGNGTLTPLFFSDHLVDIARAKAICSKCDLRERCLDDALERQEPWGVWGGELISGGRIVAVKRPCGRPPKHPRPEVRVDEMGHEVGAGLGVAVA